MSEDTTARWGLPLLHAGQAQKEMDHNEALALLDLAVQPIVMAIGLDVPPAEPGEGACWIVGTDPVGAWSGRRGALAGWTGGGWRFVTPIAGMTVTRAGDGLTARHDGTQWTIGELHATGVMVGGMRVLGSRQAAIAAPSGGAIIDTEARSSIAAVLSALRAHGLIAP
jgi:hypothetical protein